MVAQHCGNSPRVLRELSQSSPRTLRELSQSSPRALPELCQGSPRALPELSESSPRALREPLREPPLCCQPLVGPSATPVAGSTARPVIIFPATSFRTFCKASDAIWKVSPKSGVYGFQVIFFQSIYSFFQKVPLTPDPHDRDKWREARMYVSNVEKRGISRHDMTCVLVVLVLFVSLVPGPPLRFLPRHCAFRFRKNAPRRFNQHPHARQGHTGCDQK